jgi:tRNA nucleotidyltransferase (CCA-adding enzyme)
VGVVKGNSDKSKHLETATLKSNDLQVDFVQLRKETYEAGSRIPMIEHGTPIDDSFRRDLTINSLYFNLNLNAVEDFTGLGIQDIQDKLIRTPREPL